MKQTMNKLTLVLIIFVSVFSICQLISTRTVYSASDDDAATPTPAQQLNAQKIPDSADRAKWANCSNNACMADNPVIIWTKRIINFLAAGVGIVTTIMIIIGGIQYASAGPNPQAVASAKKKIVNAIIALLAYFFLYGFMQWLIPGGLF
mgnify:CR=1 FL=1